MRSKRACAPRSPFRSDSTSIEPIAGDFSRLQQVLWNPLTNAIKFTPKNGSVTVKLDKKNSRVRLKVKADGIGIDDPKIRWSRIGARDHSPWAGGVVALAAGFQKHVAKPVEAVMLIGTIASLLKKPPK